MTFWTLVSVYRRRLKLTAKPSTLAGFEHVAKPCGCSLVPAGRYTLTPISGSGKPPYSVPLIVNCVSTDAPAPRMLPVWG